MTEDRGPDGGWRRTDDGWQRAEDPGRFRLVLARDNAKDAKFGRKA